jgi:hypothetical protein
LIKEQNPACYGSGTAFFTDTANMDFHLVSGCPAIGAGAAVSDPAVDYYGYLFKTPRSVGAAEYNSIPAAVLESSRIKSPSFTVFPNPSNRDIVNIVGKSDDYDLRLYSITGKLIRIKANCGKSVRLNLAGLAKGIYTLRLKGKTDIYIQKLVVN